MNKKELEKKNAVLSLALVAVASVLLIGLGVNALRGDDGNTDDKVITETSHDSDDDDHSGHDDKDDDHSGHDDDTHEHSDESYEFADHDGLPAVVIDSVTDNNDETWALEMTTENFIIDEAAVDSPNEPGVGHMHLYVNGEKIGRVFDTSYTIEQDLSVGDEVKIGLNTNDHKTYTHDGLPIEYVYVVR